jgi:hypothetical protein
LKELAMRRCLLVCLLLTVCTSVRAADPPVQFTEPWQSAYAGEDATGKHVMGFWRFEPGQETADASGRGHTCKVAGATFDSAGRFGGALHSARGWPVQDKAHQVVVKHHADLSPTGPFTLELWIKPDRDLDSEYPDCFLVDKKYVAHCDYQLILGPGDRNGVRALRAVLGFGADSAVWNARPMRFEPGQWYHIAFTYDAAGTGAFYVNGLPAGSTTNEGRKQTSPGTHLLSIGDRVGSLYHGFPGLIDEVRLCQGVREFRRVKFERVSDRTCFVRMEPVKLRFLVTNLQREPIANAAVTIDTSGLGAKTVTIDRLDGGQSAPIDYALDTRLRPGSYVLNARFTLGGRTPLESFDTFTVRLVPRPLPDRFPVVMWGGVTREDLAQMRALGFNHALGLGCDVGKIWDAGAPTEPGKPEMIARDKALLDEALAHDFTVIATMSPAASLNRRPELLRVNRKGESNPKRPDICGLFPEIQKFCYNVGVSMAKAYGHYPAFGAAMLHTEVRDGATPCFHAHDLEAYRKATGREIPAEVNAPYGVDYKRLPGFPADRVIADDHPLYVYYRWYWKHGDGWNDLNTAVHRGLKTATVPGFWTYHDPAVRVARVFGSGGEVDYLSQWTYSYPDPIRIGLATDELFATAAGASHKQQVMKMTQIIWYRSQTAPIPKPGSQPPAFRAQWEIEKPDAPFITIAPMHLREAFWTKIARPIRGIMYHGWQSLVSTDSVGGYRFTNPDTQCELARLVREVVRPLGPTLLHVPGAKSDVAFLESFASEMFARRGTYGWCGGWAGDAYHVLQYAHLQPEIVMDETITTRGLDGFRVLVMCDCDVLTRSVADRVRAFQAQGGLIVGDDRLCPAIKPDIVITPYKRTGRADEDRAQLVALAAKLRQDLGARYTRYADSSNPDVIPYRRQYKQADYLFVVNDRREYGQYVGQHSLVMENGIPSTARVSLGRADGTLYDLLESRAVPVRREGGRLTADMSLGPCDGRVYLVAPQPIAGLTLNVPEAAERGSQVKLSLEVLDAQRKPIEAVVPVVLTVRDAEGRAAEFSGAWAAIDGKLEVTLDIAANDPFGVWQIEARELASGQHAQRSLRIAAPAPWPPARKPIPKELANPVQPKG